MNFARLLKKGTYTERETAGDNDKLDLYDYEKGKITSAEMIAKFKRHNGINKKVEIDTAEFNTWLRSLGWHV